MKLTGFSQDTETRTVKVSAIKLIMKDIQKFDSLKVAYKHKTTVLNDLISSNMLTTKELGKSRRNTLKIQSQIDKVNKIIIKNSKRKFNTILTASSIGIIVGVLIANK